MFRAYPFLLPLRRRRRTLCPGRCNGVFTLLGQALRLRALMAVLKMSSSSENCRGPTGQHDYHRPSISSATNSPPTTGVHVLPEFSNSENKTARRRAGVACRRYCIPLPFPPSDSLSVMGVLYGLDRLASNHFPCRCRRMRSKCDLVDSQRPCKACKEAGYGAEDWYVLQWQPKSINIPQPLYHKWRLFKS